MKKFSVPTQMDTVLQVIAKKYRIHFRRYKGCYFATWDLRNGVTWSLCCNARTGKMCATIIGGTPKALRLYRRECPFMKGFHECMRLARRLLERSEV